MEIAGVRELVQRRYKLFRRGSKMAEMIRVGTRIRKDLNDWLDQQSEETGLPKSTQIMMAIEMYQQQKMAKGQITELGELISKLEELSKKVED